MNSKELWIFSKIFFRPEYGKIQTAIDSRSWNFLLQNSQYFMSSLLPFPITNYVYIEKNNENIFKILNKIFSIPLNVFVFCHWCISRHSPFPSYILFHKAQSWGTANQANKKAWNPHLPEKAIRLEPKTEVLRASPWRSRSGAHPPESHPINESISSAILPLPSPPRPPTPDHLITICFSRPSKVTEKMSYQDS